MRPSDPTLDCWWTVDATLDGGAPGATYRTMDLEPSGNAARAGLPVMRLAESAGQDADLALVAVLGEGGMGVVHLATQASLHREVAVKRTRTSEPGAQQALVREARIMGRLEHPNVIPVHALGSDDDGRPALVMKRVQGVSWRTLLDEPEHPAWHRRLPLSGEPVTRHIHVLLDVCNALGFAHARGVVHRDLKPDNVMVGEFGEVYVLDWGLAAEIGEETPAGRGLLGTPSYMPPELLHRPCVAAPTVDVYLLGACLHEILTGEPRHGGSDIREVLRAASASEPVDYPPQVPRALADLCNRATAADPGQRPPTVDAFRDALTAWLRWSGSERLAETARAHVQRLAQAVAADMPDPVEVHGILEACRATLLEVERERPGDPEAADLWCQALQAGARFDLDQGALTSAEALIAELCERGRDVTELRADLARYRRQADRLRSLSRELDYSVSEGPRALLVTAALTLVVLFTVISTYRTYVGESAPIIIGYPLVLCGTLALFAPFLWPWLRRNRVNRQAAGALTTMTLGWLSLRASMWLVEADLRTVLTADLISSATWMAMLGVFVRPWLALPVPVLLVGCLLTTQLPRPQWGFLPTILLGVVALGVGWARSNRPGRPRSDRAREADMPSRAR